MKRFLVVSLISLVGFLFLGTLGYAQKVKGLEFGYSFSNSGQGPYVQLLRGKEEYPKSFEIIELHLRTGEYKSLGLSIDWLYFPEWFPYNKKNDVKLGMGFGFGFVVPLHVNNNDKLETICVDTIHGSAKLTLKDFVLNVRLGIQYNFKLRGLYRNFSMGVGYRF